MPRELSREEAEGRLSEVVTKFDWAGEFLGNHKDDFLRTYRALHAQLREGDKLEIEIEIDRHENTRCSTISYPIFKIVLHRPSGMPSSVLWSGNKDMYTHIASNLLYG